MRHAHADTCVLCAINARLSMFANLLSKHDRVNEDSSTHRVPSAKGLVW